MSVKIKMKPTSVIKARLGINPDGDVQKYFTHTCRIHMDKYVPFDSGNLAINNVQEETNKVIYGSPYAHYQYEGKVMGPSVPIKREGTDIIVGWFSPLKPKYYTGQAIHYNTDKHSEAGPFWDKRMWSAEKDIILREMQNYIKRRK